MKVEVGSERLYQHYEYNPLGQLARVYLSTGGSYDPQNDDPEVTYTYTPTGAVDKIVYEGGKEVEYGYTIRDWVESINDIDNPQGSFAGLYEYQKNGNISMSRFYNPDVHQDLSDHKDYRYVFDYDPLNRLTGAEYRYGASTNGTATNRFDVGGLSYDANGNILSLQRRDDAGTLVDNLTYNYGANNQLSSVNDAAGQIHNWDAFSSSFDYDANGNMISQSGKFTNIAYEHRNLPIHFYLDGGDELIANYNAEGQRILKEFSGGGWSFYVTDGMQTLVVFDQDGLSHMNLVGGGTFGRIMANGSGAITTSNTRYYHLTDHLGSTRAVVNNSGALAETFDYYPFGLLMPKRNTASAETREKFTGHERDDEVGLDYMVARMYDPAVARFLGVDLLSDEFTSWSPYTYVFNNPLMFTDPTGMSPVCGESQNCDDTYSVGAVVENRLGSWQYVGNNQWETLSLAENVTEITSGAGRAWHRFNNINDHFHDFGDRTIAENTSGVVTLSMMDNAGSWLVGGPARGAVALASKGVRQGGLNLFKWGEVTTTTATGWRSGDRMLNLQNRGTPKLNWKQNAGYLRQEMRSGNPIYDSFRYLNGQQIPTGGFLRAERYLLESRGWRYNPSTGAYHPPRIAN